MGTRLIRYCIKGLSEELKFGKRPEDCDSYLDKYARIATVQFIAGTYLMMTDVAGLLRVDR